MTTPYFSFDAAAFRAQFPQFASPTTFPTLALSGYFTTAGSYVTNSNYGWLNGVDRFLALNLLTAHLAALFAAINAEAAGSSQPGIVTGAQVDKVSVTLEAPPTKDGWQYWLAQTPYGLQLWALLNVKSAGGWYVGGSNTRGGFRGANGFAC